MARTRDSILKSTLTIQHIRASIWKIAKGKIDTINQAKANISFTDDYTALLKEVRKLTKKPRTQQDDSWKPRYRAAHVKYQERETPSIIRDQLKMMQGVEGFKPEDIYLETKYPDTSTANGLTTMICQYLLWMQHRATRINVMGRVVETKEAAGFGQTITTKKHLPSATRKGSADISSTINAKSAMWEVKVGRDSPSDAQLREQAKEIKAGGYYFFVHDPCEFFQMYDSLFSQ